MTGPDPAADPAADLAADPAPHLATHARLTPDATALVMADGTRTYAELEAASNRIAHALRARGLRRGDTVTVLLPNTAEWFDVVWAAQRCGLYITPLNWHLAPAEVAYVLGDSGADALIAAASLADTAAALGPAADAVRVRLSVGGTLPGFEPLDEAVAGLPSTPVDDEAEGAWMFYSSGTTGRPKGIRPPLPDPVPSGTHPFLMLLSGLYGFGPDTVYLSPSPLYHAAPAGWTTGTQRLGGTVVAMTHFDPEELLRQVERHHITHVQLVPTHLIRLLKLPEDVRRRYDLSSLRRVVHSAAPCPVEVKRAALEWLGPIVHEFYAGSEGISFCAIGPEEWLAHPGSVGRSLLGAVHVLGDDGAELPVGEEGELWFETPHRFDYHGAAAGSAPFDERGWSTLGDVGRVDAEGYLYLTDRASNMIISGGVNIYPREAEDVLVQHPAVADVAVVAVPDDDLGERARAHVQLEPSAVGSAGLAAELLAFCRDRLSLFKCPREVVFVDAVPRLPNGKLLKRLLMTAD